MLIRAFITHKKAELYSDCQDRFRVNSDTKSIAVSDGMSQSIFQKYWAQILVDTYTATDDWVPNLESVREVSSLWDKKVWEIVNQNKASENSQSNRAGYKAEYLLKTGKSAGATILGLRFKNSLEWICDVLGDSCMILIEDDHIKDIITSEDVDVFDNYPDFYDSNPNRQGKGKLRTTEGRLSQGQSILLVSDPFSDYLLKNKGTEKEAQLVERLLSINTHEEFEEVVELWRNQEMRNDDSTLVIIKSDDSENFNLDAIDNIDDLIKDEQAKEKYQITSATANTKTSENEEIGYIDIGPESSLYTTLRDRLNNEEVEKKIRQCIRNMIYNPQKKNIRQSPKRQKPVIADKLIWEAIKKQLLNFLMG